MSKKILILCYAFPPFPGIGGRRWAKFAKYLQRNGHEVFVIAAENPFPEKSLWLEDIKGINVTYLPIAYPKVLITQPKNILEKLAYRFALKKVKKAEGNYYDRALYWKEQLLEKGKDLITRHHINNIIVSGAPFHLTHHALAFKEIFPDSNLIVDFRDFWTKDISISSYSSLSEKRKRVEQKMEEEVVNVADHVLTVAEEMRNYFQGISRKNNCNTLLNGFDPDDFHQAAFPIKKQEEVLRFVFTGTLYLNSENVFHPFIDALKKIKENKRSSYQKLKFDFFGSISETYKQYVKSQGVEIINFHPSLTKKEVYQKIAAADVCLLFLNDVYNFSMSTKFYEYLSQHKKILLISHEGTTANFIQEHELGFWLNPKNAEEDLLNALKYFKSGTSWTSKLDIQQFSISNITKALEKFLIN